MGLETPRIPRFFLLSLVLSSSLLAAPKLRLSTAAVGPVSIATNSNGTAQTVEAYNIGDGALSLSVAGSANWLVPGVGAARACTTTSGACIPIQIGLQTAALAAGIYTGTVTVSDANAVDAPQTITVTVQMGGGVPDRVELFVPPNGTGKFPFATNSQVRSSVSTQNGQPWLSLALEGGGSFSFVYSYAVTANGREGMGDGTYDGSITLSGSTFAPDNKRIAVTMRVTSQPIAQVAPQRLSVRMAQNVPKQTKYLVLSNGGLGTLAISNVAVAITGGGTWLTAGSPIGLLVPLAFDTANLAAGKYQATVTVATNGANGNLAVPVELEVVAQSPPVLSFRGVVNNATFEADTPVSQGGIAAAFGEQLFYKEPLRTPGTSWPTELGGTRVLVNNQPVPVYYASYDQINFQVPYDATPGSVEVRVERDGQRGNVVSLAVAERAPKILTLGATGYGVIVNYSDGSFPMPPTPGIPSHPAKAGDVLVIYAINLGQTTPPIAAGAVPPGQEPLARVVPTPMVYFNGGLMGTAAAVSPSFAGLSPGWVGLYQLNVVVPEGLHSTNLMPIYIDMEGVKSNVVYIALE